MRGAPRHFRELVALAPAVAETVLVDDAQQRFLERLEEFDAYLSRGKTKQARKILNDLSSRVGGQTDETVRAQMQAMVTAQRDRLKQLERRQQANRIIAAARHDAKPPNAKCEKCGQGFRRGRKETGRPVCSICRPLGTKSVRAVGGGLPTLGKHRK